jgi:hypothetical protein
VVGLALGILVAQNFYEYRMTDDVGTDVPAYFRSTGLPVLISTLGLDRVG